MASNVIPAIRRAEPSIFKCFKNVVLHRADPNLSSALSESPQLVVVFPWVGAKERYAHKFVDAWVRRGFDVLHVTTPVMDLVKPKTGTEVTASRVADYLDINDKYNVIFHGISVGGYLGQRVLMSLQGTTTLNRLTHQIYDSFTHVAGFDAGVENGVNPKYRNLAKFGVKLYKKVADLSCLQAAGDFVDTVPSTTPNLFIHSLADKVANYDYIRNSIPVCGRNNPAFSFLVPEEEQIGHVLLFRAIGEISYMSIITRFMRRNNFAVLRPEVLLEEDATTETAKLHIDRMKRVAGLSLESEQEQVRIRTSPENE